MARYQFQDSILSILYFSVVFIVLLLLLENKTLKLFLLCVFIAAVTTQISPLGEIDIIARVNVGIDTMDIYISTPSAGVLRCCHPTQSPSESLR